VDPSFGILTLFETRDDILDISLSVSCFGWRTKQTYSVWLMLC